MLASDRTVFGRQFSVTPTWVWLLQRGSAVLLGPLVAIHVWLPGMAGNRVLSFVLLAIVVTHGYTGLRRMDTRTDSAWRSKAIAGIWSLAVTLLGAAVVFS